MAVRLLSLSLTVILISALALICGCGDSSPRPSDSATDQFESLCVRAKIALRQGDAVSAKAYATEALQLQPTDATALELAGDSESLVGANPQAASFYESSVKELTKPPFVLLDKLGRTYMACGRPFDAASTLEQAVQLYDDNRSLRTDYVGLLAALGREQEALPHLQWLIMRGFGSINELSMVSDLTRSQVDSKICDYALRYFPSDLRPHYSLARDEVFKRDWKAVASTLEPVIAAHPDFAAAQAHYGRALVETRDDAAIVDWAKALPQSIQNETEYWIACGVFAEHRLQMKEATRAYWQACRLDPNHAEALGRLSLSLSKLDMPEPSKACANRAGQISRLRDQVDSLHARQNNSQVIVSSIAKTLESLGRLWEAAAWLRIGAGMSSDKDASLVSSYNRIRTRLDAKTPWQLAEQDIAKQLDFRDWPVTDWQSSDEKQLHEQSDTMLATSPIRFFDVAAKKGLNHLCKIQPPQDPESGVWIYQTSAGGAASIDFDLDGWPDVCLSTIDGTPLQNDSGPNRLYRNLNGMFRDVTEHAAVGDQGFTQGFSVSDFNQDGFDDLYVANIGKNHVYLNCGDGTFREVSEVLGLNGQQWTSSAAFVDLDQDGFVDLFEVNYCDIQQALNVPCSQDGKANPCLPTTFNATSDRVWKGQPDGRFVEQTQDWLVSHEAGRGFGIVTGYFDDQPGIDVYIANDMTANHFWSSNPSQGKPFQLVEQAYIRGVAVDRSSRSQASMGIAAGDPDRDGDVDFYVSHFASEYNTYYEQTTPGIWADISESNGQAAITMPVLGFGTQFVDADNDGKLELIVANGHVYNYESEGVAYRMPSLLMSRSQDGMWSVVPPSGPDDFFATKHISRSLICFDFNRDGRTDSLITHLFDPVSLLVNETESNNQSLTLFLKATSTHVDAIGSKVSMVMDDQPVAMQLIGGGGFQCSNQRCLSIGMGKATAAEQVAVTWPSGTKESFGSIPGSGEWLLVEGEGAPVEMNATDLGAPATP